MVDIGRKAYERNCVETINNDGMLWLNDKNIEEGLHHKNLWEITTKYSDHRKHKYEIVDQPKKTT